MPSLPSWILKFRRPENKAINCMFYVSGSSFFSCNDVYQSIKQEKNNIEWTVQFAFENSYVKVLISNKPIGKITCPLVPWTVTFDVCFLNTYVHQYDKRTMERKVETKIDAVTSAEFATVKMNNYFVEDNDVSLRILITNIRWKGIHKFELKSFDSIDAGEDLVLNVDGVKLHCHSQILSRNSKIFRAMIEESEVSSEICLEDTIPVEDLRELLHYLYFPCEPVDDHNFRQLLHWGQKFEVKHVVQLCHQYMESLMRSPYLTRAIRWELFLLSWRYSIKPLKRFNAIRTIRFESPDWMMKIVQTELYQDMDEDLKLQMWEFVIKNI